MRPESLYYEVTPMVLRADREAEVRIRPLFGHCRFGEGAEYAVSYFPTEEFAQRSGWPANSRGTVKPRDGVLRIRRYFEGEQEHVLLVEQVTAQGRKRVGEFRVYSLAEDLFTRRPHKGEFHIHSCYSDGVESPGYVAAACRRIGMDFMALTDHRRYEPSLEAQRAFEGVDIDLRIYPGEEVHPPDNPVHIVNFGGRLGLTELFAKEGPYWPQVRAIQSELCDLPSGVDPYQYASCLWCFDRIREARGLGVFCHPYWFTENRYAPSGAITSHLFCQQPFDAYEVIGGYDLDAVDSNTLQAARYHEERAAGRRIPIVGASDAHGCEKGALFGWYYTVVFSPTLELPDIIGSIKELYSVAVEALPGTAARAHGPFRLVKYALFLLREVMPQHDELCREEGRLMLAHLAGDGDATHVLRSLKGRTSALMNRLWAPSP